MKDTRDTPPNRRKVRDRSMVHLLAGVALLLPPIVGVAAVDDTFAGIPIPLLYIFGVWLALIVVAMVLAGRLSEADETADPVQPGNIET